MTIASVAGCVAVTTVLSFGRPQTPAGGHLKLAAHGGFRSASVVAQKSSKQVWIAASQTARSITGDITLTSDKLILAHTTFPLTFVRDVKKEKLEDAGKIVDLSGSPSSARLFKTLVSRHSILLNSNTICGPDADATWMLAVYNRGTLSLTFFSGAKEPNLDYKAAEASPYICGTYMYVSPGR